MDISSSKSTDPGDGIPVNERLVIDIDLFAVGTAAQGRATFDAALSPSLLFEEQCYELSRPDAAKNASKGWSVRQFGVEGLLSRALSFSSVAPTPTWKAWLPTDK
jgi:hypothetical protein